ncbi:Uncharacterised protein [Serratia quinivorans]|uniref:portal protein n=1 Tax=Serratia quinivorans TaxID=137545 RepID=UPI00217A7799|nr:hypothetical protein [Serratia quinivorans]CAI1768593.1 Uncharacterised protein [Serratia quinivorans]
MSKMNKEQLFTEVWDNFNAADEIKGMITERYTNAYMTYRGELPAIKKVGDLPADRIMWQAFESIYPSLVALFTDSQKSPVAFDADAAQTAPLAKAITKAVHNAALKVNNAYRMYMCALKEILITGNQAALVGYDSKDYQTDKYNFTDAPLAEVVARSEIISKSGYNIEQELTIDEDGMTATGWVQGKQTVKFPVISLIDFKNFYIHPNATDVEGSQYTAYKEDLTVAEGVERGYSEADMLNAERQMFQNDAGLSKQLLVVDDMDTELNGPDSVMSDLNNTVTIYHHYWRGCYNSKKSRLHYVVSTDTTIMKVEVVDYCPLVLGGMSIVTGSAWSESLFDICYASQVSKTRAMRAIQRSADGAAYSEYMFIDAQMDKAGREAFASRGPGGAYSVKSPQAITKLPTTDVPNAMQLLNQEINASAEKTIQGSAGQAQVLEENGQASGVAVALTQDKQELNESQIAKTIAETFIKPMYKILLLVLQEMGSPVDIDGVQIPLKTIRSDLGLSIDVETTYDRASAAANIKQAFEQAAQLGTLPANITDENRYNIYADYFRAASGQEDVSRWITPPDDMPKPTKEQQMVKAVTTISELRGHIAATELAEAKVQDMKADAQKKYNDSLLDLANIKKILEDIDHQKVTTLLAAQQQKHDAQKDNIETAQQQEQIDNQAANQATNQPAA